MLNANGPHKTKPTALTKHAHWQGEMLDYQARFSRSPAIKALPLMPARVANVASCRSVQALPRQSLSGLEERKGFATSGTPEHQQSMNTLMHRSVPVQALFV